MYCMEGDKQMPRPRKGTRYVVVRVELRDVIGRSVRSEYVRVTRQRRVSIEEGDTLFAKLAEAMGPK